MHIKTIDTTDDLWQYTFKPIWHMLKYFIFIFVSCIFASHFRNGSIEISSAKDATTQDEWEDREGKLRTTASAGILLYCQIDSGAQICHSPIVNVVVVVTKCQFLYRLLSILVHLQAKQSLFNFSLFFF